ncbi:hypothetical protein KI387_027571, partial [Taxus chinensis]
NRCVNIKANLFNVPLGDAEEVVCVGTIGSSDAIMLAGLAFKRKWQNKLDPVKVVEMVDENTFCAAAILGSTYNGEFEDVKLLN